MRAYIVWNDKTEKRFLYYELQDWVSVHIAHFLACLITVPRLLLVQ